MDAPSAAPPLSFKFVLSPAALDVAAGAAFVASPRAGGLACFVGTTRELTARGERVARLEFEAHAPLAAALLRGAANDAQRAARGALVAIYVAHRTGAVGVGEAAVVVWAAAPHRAEALAAVRDVVDALKAHAPIWKREVLESGAAAWKANAEAGAGGGCCAP